MAQQQVAQDTGKILPRDRPRCAECGIRPRQRRSGKGAGHNGFYTKCSVCRGLDRIARTESLIGSDYQRAAHLAARAKKNMGYVLVNGKPLGG